MDDNFDVVIIGRGIAGLSAAIYCARLGVSAIVIGEMRGGTLMDASMIENYPGFSAISGKGLIKKVEEHLENYKPNILDEKVIDISKAEENFIVKTKEKEIFSKAVIFATGSRWRMMNVKGEEEFKGKGVHYCALCDGFFYKGKTIAVLGGGDSAVKEVFLLSKYAKNAYIITDGKLKAEPINIERIKNEKNIEIIEDAKIKEIKGDKFVNSVVFDREYNGSDILSLDGVFVEIGRLANSELATGLGVGTNNEKEIIIDKSSKTNIPGVFAAGDCTDTKIKQAITGVGEAVKAAYSAYEYINNKEIIRY